MSRSAFWSATESLVIGFGRLGDPASHLLPDAGTLLGQLDQLHPAVPFGRRAAHQAALLHPVDDAGHVRVVAVHHRRQLAHRARLVEEAQHDPLWRREHQILAGAHDLRTAVLEEKLGGGAPGFSRHVLSSESSLRRMIL